MYFIALVISLAQALGSPGTPAQDTTALEKLAQSALSRLEKMRGQKLTKPLKMGVKNRAEILRFINRRLADEYGPKRVNAEGELLRLQGLLPKGLDYGKFVAKLLAEQVAGFYDHTRQELHIADWIPSMVQAPVLAHEIFHAIQDQEWGGGKLIDSKKYRHDAVLAHAALLEGDATIMMFNYSQSDMDVSTSSVMANMIAASIPAQMGGAQYPVLASAPAYLKQSLIFPYAQGFLFLVALRQQGLTWADIRNVYRDPPSSTEQILHPQKYLKPRDRPSLVALKAPILPGFKHIWTETLGEFHFRQLLLEHMDVADASAAAEGWDGDLTVLATDGRRQVAVTVSTWDTEADARQFEAALKTAYATVTPPPAHLETMRTSTTLAMAWSLDKKLAKEALQVAFSSAKVTRR
ncbi:MAG: hypothetical protein VX589_19975 [Myxococcota bacterium]|nr:hypothetical protein [Myxococcota bacterium]